MKNWFRSIMVDFKHKLFWLSIALVFGCLIEPVFQYYDQLPITIGCVVTMFGPAVYDLYKHECLRRNQMWLYTLGWLGSILFIGYWFVIGLFSTLGSGIGASLPTDLIVLSSLAYIPILIMAIILGWIAYRTRHLSVARIFMLLPLIDVTVYVIGFITTFSGAIGIL